MPPWSHPAILSWAGMRGVVSLAAALALPARFPARDIIVFLAFCAIFATLVVQGTTLGWVIRRLGVEEEDAPPEPETARARAELARAAFDAVRDHVDDITSEHGQAAAELVEEYRVRAHRASVGRYRRLTRRGPVPVATSSCSSSGPVCWRNGPVLPPGTRRITRRTLRKGFTS